MPRIDPSLQSTTADSPGAQAAADPDMPPRLAKPARPALPASPWVLDLYGPRSALMQEGAARQVDAMISAALQERATGARQQHWSNRSFHLNPQK